MRCRSDPYYTGQLRITAPRSKGAPHPFRRDFSEKWAHPKNFRFWKFLKNKRSPKRAEGAKILRFLVYFQGNLVTFSNTTNAPQNLQDSSRKISAPQDFQNLDFLKFERTLLKGYEQYLSNCFFWTPQKKHRFSAINPSSGLRFWRAIAQKNGENISFHMMIKKFGHHLIGWSKNSKTYHF